MELDIFNKVIRVDKYGRYNLNDIHAASGGEEKNKPSNWLRLDNVKATIEVISKGSDMSGKILESKSGRYGGTYAIKMLTYYYIMWISPEFSVYALTVLENHFNQECERRAVRNNTRDGYKCMSNALKTLTRDDIKPYHYSSEADMLNVIVLGTTAKGFQKKHGIPEHEAIRDYFTKDQIDAIDNLQKFNEQLLLEGMRQSERRTKLQARFDRTFVKLLPA